MMNSTSKALDAFLRVSGRASGSSEGSLAALSAATRSLPDDYLNFLRISNGAEGPIGSKNYLVLWSIEELEQTNVEYGTSEFAPGLVLVGTDGGNTGYGFDCRVPPYKVVEVQLAGMNWDDAKQVADTFTSFVRVLWEES